MDREGKVAGLKEAMSVTKEYAEELLSDPAKFALFVADLERQKLIIHALHVLTFVSPVPGVPAIVLRVIPAAHGKATEDITLAIEQAVQMLAKNGITARWVCTDGDSTYVSKLAHAFSLLRDVTSYDFGCPVHRQAALHSMVPMPESGICFCIDIDHQGKAMRYLYLKGDWLIVFPAFGMGVGVFSVNVDVLKAMGVPDSLLRDTTGTKMDDVLASKLFSGHFLIEAGLLMQQAIDVVDAQAPPSFPLSERQLYELDLSWEEEHRQMRVYAAAYWLHVPWVCVYLTMHGSLSPASRLEVASYGFCTVLLMLLMRTFIPPEHVPAQRRGPSAGRSRWAMSEEMCKKYLVTVFAIICGLGEIKYPTRANVFGTLTLERFFSSVRRVCHNNSHFLHMWEMLRLALLMTTIRTRLGLSPDLEEGTRRQKHGDVLFMPLPGEFEGVPMGHTLSLVLTAMVRSRVAFPPNFMESLDNVGVRLLPDDTECFIEAMVGVAGNRLPATATLRNTRIIATGGVAPTQRFIANHQVAHAADGAGDAVTPPSPGGAWIPEPGAPPTRLFPFDTEPPP